MTSISSMLSGYWDRLVAELPTFIVAVAVFVAFWIVARYSGIWLARLVKHTGADPHINRVLSRLSKIVILILGLVTALGTMGIHLTALVATIGLAGFAISFAFKDIIGNFLAGLMLMFQRPFKIGESISVAGVDGTVEDIRIRDTVIKMFDGKKAILPNQSIIDGTIISYSAEPVRRFSLAVGIGYGDDIGRAITVCGEILAGVEGIVDAPAPQIFATGFGLGAIDIEARYWVDTRVGSPALIKSDLMHAIKQRFQAEGIEIPVPLQSVQVQKK